MPFNVGLPEVILFLVIALLIFGPKRLPEMGRSIGRGIQEFKSGITSKNEPEEERPLAVEEQVSATTRNEAQKKEAAGVKSSARS